MVRLKPLSRIAFEPGGIKTGGIDLEHIGEQGPRPVDRFFFEVITERPVPEHLKERVVIGVMSDVFEVVVLSSGSNAFLTIDGPCIGPIALSEKDIFELIHASVREQEGGILVRYGRARRHDLVPRAGSEEVEELLTNLRGGQSGHAEFRARSISKNATV